MRVGETQVLDCHRVGYRDRIDAGLLEQPRRTILEQAMRGADRNAARTRFETGIRRTAERRAGTDHVVHDQHVIAGLPDEAGPRYETFAASLVHDCHRQGLA